jgi:hypothetical protein
MFTFYVKRGCLGHTHLCLGTVGGGREKVQALALNFHGQCLPSVKALSTELDLGEVTEVSSRPIKHHPQGQHHKLGCWPNVRKHDKILI